MTSQEQDDFNIHSLLIIRFEDDQVTLQTQDLTGLGGVTLVGRLEG